ncbi:unnamed protein product [Caenorhabditis angaria]|uniref:Peptidase M13 C-terminal domain-containing protein n=1 Tax=Caenorhabditis angaria TaxID=860376 RepID=A0A9P1ICX2_9PELO|nr:unnamed protein product [Caenorhabditis angaria]
MALEIGPITKSSEKFNFKEFRKSIITALIFLAIIFLLYVRNRGFIEKSEVTPSIYEENICKTKECKILGKRMKSIMNPKIDPCDDFYESICGKYPKNNTDEVREYQNDDYNDLSTFIKTFKPVTKSEKIAMTVLKKCMEKSEEHNKIDMSYWNNLQNHSLTDVLIEAAKINPKNTGFLKNIVNMAHNSKTNSKYLYLLITQGLEKNSEMDKLFDEILKKNETLRKSYIVRLDDSVKNSISFIDLQKYVYFLLPEEYRGLKNDGEWYVDINALLVLQEITKMNGVDGIKEIIKKRWKSTILKYLVEPESGKCFEKLTRLFPGTLATIFVKNFVGSKNLQRANELFKELQKVFIEMLEKNNWMDQKLKDVLIQEVLDVKSSIGIPDEHKNQENIDKMYARIGDYENQLYLELVQNLLKMNSEETFLRVSRREEITYQGSTIGFNANYFRKNHRTTIGPFLLNFPYIDRNLPEWNNFATLGYLLGHEIGHAFDAEDFYINPMRKDIAMSTKMKQIFKDRIDCIIEKYDEYQFSDGTFSNGTRTRTEDSADMIGFNLAYRLFKKLNNIEKLPSLEKYTVEQQYFHRLGYLWSSAELNEFAILFSQFDTHSALKFRVNGMMSNSEEFAKAYNCPKNSPMNPEKKCPLFK